MSLLDAGSRRDEFASSYTHFGEKREVSNASPQVYKPQSATRLRFGHLRGGTSDYLGVRSAAIRWAARLDGCRWLRHTTRVCPGSASAVGTRPGYGLCGVRSIDATVIASSLSSRLGYEESAKLLSRLVHTPSNLSSGIRHLAVDHPPQSVLRHTLPLA